MHVLKILDSQLKIESVFMLFSAIFSSSETK